MHSLASFLDSLSISGGTKTLPDMDKMDLKQRLAGLLQRLAGEKQRLAGEKQRLAGIAYLITFNVFFTVAVWPS
jgi:hypothetical protein